MPDQPRPIVKLSEEQTRIDMDSAERRTAISAAYRITMSPHEWGWSDVEQHRMASYVLWAHQRLSAIKQLTEGELNHDE